jgi:hypothetical protein
VFTLARLALGHNRRSVIDAATCLSSKISVFSLAAWLVAPAVFAVTVPPASRRCSTFTGSASPITHCTDTNYLCYAGVTRPLVGVSADAACHIPLSANDKCNLSNSQDVLQSTITNGLNKIRLWVAIAGNSPVTIQHHEYDHPFAYVPSGGYWRLDIANETYFSHLQDVIDYCRLDDTTVEVTFFVPWEGDYANGPWNGSNGRVCIDGAGNFQPGDTNCTQMGHSLVSAGFSSQDQFVRPGSDPINGNRPRQVQLNLIQWTIDRLYCYDNVYWEIANEPESAPVNPKPDPMIVSQWQANMVQQTLNKDNFYVSRIPGEIARHLIAVNPTTTGFDYVNAIGTLANVAIVNGHYTEIFSNGNLGALQLMQRSGDAATNAFKVLGFNETKISAILGDSGTLPAGESDSARAEGWEFMLSHGGIYDHWGYDYSSTNGQNARIQMMSLKNFLGGLVLRQLTKSAADTLNLSPPKPPAWVPSLPTWGTYNSARAARLFWAALNPTSTATTKQYVLYLHNSLRRCKNGGTDTSAGCSTSNLGFEGYNPVICSGKTGSCARYQETLTLSLPPASYTAEWVKPYNNADWLGSPFTLTVNANGSCGGNPNPPCTITSPSYAYDIALKLTKQ